MDDDLFCRAQVRVMAIYVSTDPRDESWAVAIDASGSVLDHLQIPYGRDVRAAKIKVCILLIFSVE